MRVKRQKLEDEERQNLKELLQEAVIKQDEIEIDRLRQAIQEW